LEEARRSVQDLRAAPLAGRPLPEALAALARTFTSDTGVRVHVRTIGSTGGGVDARLPLHVEAELYRIAQEALANVRQHAKAREVEITLRRAPRSLRLTIHDDGAGLPRDLDLDGGPTGANRSRQDGRGHGIPGMRERAQLLGGDLRLASRPGRGTTVVANVPLGHQEPAA
jgi:two-component system NarL family sensor kinase